ncbi:isoprenylcysteine carboxylmethyltransferase family protein [Actinocorallia longicatena]|uniref:Isoprenylcysteine carboxylmethyltransferase family protein n=1 Tax=Actinocorallia longicatena TaxID=111803 RepID=A0ABP6Q2U6_9ACTN
MPTIALVLSFVWALSAFVLRAWIQWRRYGDTGLRGPGKGAGRPIALLLSAGLLCGAAGSAGALLGLDPLAFLDHTVVSRAGLAVAVAGVVGTVITQLAMGASWRVGVDPAERTDLVTSGPFGLVRNPIYSAMITTVAGLAAMTPNAVALAGLLLTILAIELQVRVVEEPHLRRVHGSSFDHYTASVGRFLPLTGRS